MATMYVTEPGSRIEKEYRRILVIKDDEVIKATPVDRLSEVVLVGRGVGATTPALHMLLEAGVGLTLISHGGELLGRLVPPTPKNIPARQAQYATARDPAFCLRVSQAIVAGKLRNSRAMARRVLRDRLAAGGSDGEAARAHIAAIARCLKALPEAATLDTLRGLEGQAARAYFAVWGQAFSGELAFERRSRRPPQDPVNALLGLGYSLLTQNLATACEVVGLDPYDGFFHADKYGRPALALDLVEEFRAIVVDSLVRLLVNKRLLGAGDFVEREGGVYLKRAGLRTFFAQYSHRLNARVIHPHYGRTLSYQQCFEVQARLLRQVIEGQLDAYPPFVVK
ncbi:MAG: CRISPR-associated endonuclease Cas1 [Anaerolineae bacterium]|nr:CRISPR-associated endonuclease Cas1 [Anaerolineae bacterium]